MRSRPPPPPHNKMFSYLQSAAYSTKRKGVSGPARVGLVKRAKKNILEYGIVGTIFHLSTSLLMFGSCYLIVTR